MKFLFKRHVEYQDTSLKENETIIPRVVFSITINFDNKGNKKKTFMVESEVLQLAKASLPPIALLVITGIPKRINKRVQL